jgi:hypothetical protein
MHSNSFISALKKNSIFKFLSSVRLAVPLMLILLFVSAIGTIYESQYNALFAKLTIYDSWWFLLLLIFLWINIFCATISRIPFQKHHIGFVITHIGLLSLLGGAFITSQSGIDGQLQVQQGKSENRVILSDLELGYQFDDSPTRQSASLHRNIEKLDEPQLSKINKEFEHLFTVEKYIPFDRFDLVFQTNPEVDPKSIALSFNLKSKFFNVSEWLNTESTPQLNMGPATLKIFIDSQELQTKNLNSAITKAKKPHKTSQQNYNQTEKISQNSKTDKLIVQNSKTKELVKSVSISEFKKNGLKINGAKILLKNLFLRAVVRDNKLAEGDGDRNNPALEISIEKDGTSTRDILYAKFPEFSLRKENNIGLDFIYQTDTEARPSSQPAIHENNSVGIPTDISEARQGNTIEFYLDLANPKQARIELYKNQELTAKETIRIGQTYQTPWMGITITIGAIIPQAKLIDLLTEIKPQKGQDLPPSAILVRLKNSDESLWFAEGETKSFSYNSRTISLFYGPKIITLPFDVALDQFSKIDYPGTNTPLSFESLVRINSEPDQIKISMNEPFKKDSFTLYQSSYILNPGQTPVSIFSANKDPGRPIKYAGSLILCLGILIFTLMKSRYGKLKPR